jgi:hypothetical protein
MTTNTLRLCKALFPRAHSVPGALSPLSSPFATAASSLVHHQSLVHKHVPSLLSVRALASISSSSVSPTTSAPYTPFSTLAPFSSSTAVSSADLEPSQSKSTGGADAAVPQVSLVDLKSQLREAKASYNNLQDAIANYRDPVCG